MSRSAVCEPDGVTITSNHGWALAGRVEIDNCAAYSAPRSFRVVLPRDRAGNQPASGAEAAAR